MKYLITGSSGFIGQHVIRLLRDAGQEVVGLSRRTHATSNASRVMLCNLEEDPPRLAEILGEVKPDAVIHLAATTFEPRATSVPWQVLQNNLRSTLNLLTVSRSIVPAARILIVSSGAVYGRSDPVAGRITESCVPSPLTIYGVSKLSCEALALQHHRAHNQKVIIARPFNLTGPGEHAVFATSAFARQIAQIEAGKRPPVLRVGQLDTTRDFTDVRDVADALIRLAGAGRLGEIYNVCSGVGIAMSAVVTALLQSAKAQIAIAQDPALMRPVEIPNQVGDPTKISGEMGWARKYVLDNTLSDVLIDWRERIQMEND